MRDQPTPEQTPEEPSDKDFMAAHIEALKEQVDALTATLVHLTQERDELRRAADCPMILCPYEQRAEQAEATLARVKAQRDGLRKRAQLPWSEPTKSVLLETVAGLDAALVDPPVSPKEK